MNLQPAFDETYRRNGDKKTAFCYRVQYIDVERSIIRERRVGFTNFDPDIHNETYNNPYSCDLPYSKRYYHRRQSLWTVVVL